MVVVKITRITSLKVQDLGKDTSDCEVARADTSVHLQANASPARRCCTGMCKLFGTEMAGIVNVDIVTVEEL